MADALVSFMLGKFDTVILENFQQEVSLVVGAEKEVEKLTSTFKVIQAVLNDAEQRQIKDKAVKLWLEEFKDIVYDMDDALDEWSFEMHKSQTDTGVGKMEVISSSSSSNLLYSFFSCFGKVVLRHNIGTKIKYIRERLDMAESERQKYRLIEIRSDEKPIERLKSSSLVDVSNIFGRVTDKETIVSKLVSLGESSTSTSAQPESNSIQALHSPTIISIVGMGGLGKTTLAQLVFNDDQVQTHFDKTMWVCVSDPFDLVTVTKAIIEETKCKVPKSSEWNTLHQCLSDSIKGKRFLLVLDDVWTEDRSLWEPLEISFRYGAKGSCILVTTRNERVSLMMNATCTHSLELLSDNDCSLLLCRIALAGRNKENLEEFRNIGEKISKKCKGLPLATKILGGLLHFKQHKKEWLNILESEIWKLEEVENGFLKPALLLSYYDLPLPLKACFLYCSIFPKDYHFEKEYLVKLWMAQGFLKSTSGNDELEMIGDDYFNNLAMRSFFQDFKRDSTNENIISSKMHDLIHDFAQFLTKNECSLTQSIGTPLLINFSSRVRHLTLVCEDETRDTKDSYNYLISSIHKAKKLRTLYILRRGKFTIQEFSVNFFNHLKCLKVLCLPRISLENLSSEIGNLIHLRYLDLSYNKFKILPETISSLYNLQTLKLAYCYCLCRLPREMWRMINLRHLDIRNTDKLSHMPQGMGRLTSLITLSDFNIGVTSEGCNISELKDLHLLQGDLSITGLGRVETVNDAFQTNLKQKHLHTLALGFNSNAETTRETTMFSRTTDWALKKGIDDDVLEVLEPHPDLVELKVTDYSGFRLSKWIENTSYLCHLRILKLYNCFKLTKLPGLGELPSLEVLDIKGAEKVKHIGFEFYTNNVEHVNKVAYPKLKELHMHRMDDLEVWELKHGVVMPCVRFISLECPKLKTLPALGKLPSLEELIIKEAKELMHIGLEFLYEVDEAGGERFNDIAFPKLESLTMNTKNMEWEFGVVANTGGVEIIIMPCLRKVKFDGCMNLQPLIEVLSKMPFLKTLDISGEATEFISFLGNDNEDDRKIVVFSNVEELGLSCMDIEELKLGSKVIPSLTSLQILSCKNLKALQGFSKLKTLKLFGCSSLYELPLPNLEHLTVSGDIHPSLPQAFATTLTGLQRLTILDMGGILTCVPEQVQQLTSLQALMIYFCSEELEKRCRKDEGEDWRIISHIPNIRVLFKQKKHQSFV